MIEQQIPLKISHLNKSYGPVQAVKDVSFEMRPGEVFGLLGPNGAGKTSIISTIVTLERPTSGRVTVFGHEVQENPRQAKVLTGLVPQELINHGYFNIEEVMGFHSGYYGIWDNKERIRFLLDRLQLWEHRHKRVKQLSGGMKRRLLIAKALVHEPQLLLLDEPTAGVDIELRETLWNFVRELRSQGISILLTTHYLEEAEQLCDRVGILQEGALVKVGATEDLVRDLTHRHVKIELRQSLPQLKHHWMIDNKDLLLEFRLPSKNSLGDLLADLDLDMRDVVDLQIQEGKLEDAFRHLIGGLR